MCCNRLYDLDKLPTITGEQLREAHTVCLTGGEPFLLDQWDLIHLCGKIRQQYPNIQKVYIYSSDQRMTLYGEDFDFSTEANDRIGIDYSGGKDMTLGVKADSIIDELSRIIEPTVTIHFTDPSRAVTIQPNDPLYQGEEITMLLMPMLVNE